MIKLFRQAHVPALSVEHQSAQDELSAQMDVWICRCWAATLHGPQEWGEHPLLRYSLSERLLATLNGWDGKSLQRVASICAAVACGQAPMRRELRLQRRLTGDERSKLVRRDGASGWECTLDHPEGGLCLSYWVRLDHAIEFDTVVGYGNSSESDRDDRPRMPRSLTSTLDRPRQRAVEPTARPAQSRTRRGPCCLRSGSQWR